MEFSLLKKSVLLVALITMTALFGCSSDDDPTDPGGGGPGDTAAPRVIDVFPMDGMLMVQTLGEIMIFLDEPMDPASSAGQITMSHGTLISADWAFDSILMINYSGWPQGTRVTVTLGTGLKDTAGNGLKSPVVLSFGSWSDNLFVFGTSPASGAVDINRAATIELDFGAYVEMSSLNTGVTISDGTKANLPFTATSQDEARWILKPVDVLPANSEITVTIGTSVVSHEGTSFETPYVTTFITNDQIDTTPPAIVSLDPPSGSVIPADQQELTITFDEPIDPDTFRPTSMSAQLQWLLGQAPAEPSWNPAGDVLTVSLPSDLPAGLPLEVVFANYADMVGNAQTEETIWSLTVAGAAEAYPVHDGQRFLMIGEWADGDPGSETPTAGGEEWVYYQITARATAGQWNREEWLDPGYTLLDYYDIQSVTASAVSLVGFGEDEGDGWEEFMLSSPATWAELPPVAGNTWSQNVTVTMPDGTIDVEIEGEMVAQEDLFVGEFDGIDVTWTGAWHVRLVLDVSTGGMGLSHEVNDFWFAPGVGVVREMYREDNLEPGEEGWHTYDRWLSIELQ